MTETPKIKIGKEKIRLAFKMPIISRGHELQANLKYKFGMRQCPELKNPADASCQDSGYN